MENEHLEQADSQTQTTAPRQHTPTSQDEVQNPAPQDASVPADKPQKPARRKPAPAGENQSLVKRRLPADPSANPRPKRRRLSKAQGEFLSEIFFRKVNIETALLVTQVSYFKFARWLNNPLFLARLQNQLDVSAMVVHIETVQRMPTAVATMMSMADKLVRPEEYRKLATELVRLLGELQKMDYGSRRLQHGFNMDQYGALLERFGYKMDKNGALMACDCIKQTTGNKVFGTKNAEIEENPTPQPLLNANPQDFPKQN